MRTDRQTDLTKLIVTYRISANAPKNGDQKHLSGFPPLITQQAVYVKRNTKSRSRDHCCRA